MNDFTQILKLGLAVVDAQVSYCLDENVDTMSLHYRRLEPAQGRVVYHLTHTTLGELGQIDLMAGESEVAFKMRGPDEAQEKIAAVRAGKTGPEQNELRNTKRHIRERVFQKIMFYMGQAGVLAQEQARWGDTAWARTVLTYVQSDAAPPLFLNPEWHQGKTLNVTPTSGSLIQLPDGRLIQAMEVDLPLSAPPRDPTPPNTPAQKGAAYDAWQDLPKEDKPTLEKWLGDSFGYDMATGYLKVNADTFRGWRRYSKKKSNRKSTRK